MSFSDFEGLPQAKSIDWNGGRTAGMVNFGDGQNLFAVFYRRSTEDPMASQAAGRRIYRGVDHVRIHHPGERLTVVDRPVREDDKQRWPQQWQQYQNQQQQVPDGTPIDLLYPNHPEVADSFKAFNVHTIEQCASLSGNAIEHIGMGAQEAVNAAKRYLERAQKGVAHHEMEKMAEGFRQEVKLLHQQNDELRNEVNRLIGLLQQTSPMPVSPSRSSMMPQMPIAQPVQTMPQSGIPLPPTYPMAPPPSASGLYDVQSQTIAASHPSTEEAKKRPGWPKGKPRGPRVKPNAPDTSADN